MNRLCQSLGEAPIGLELTNSAVNPSFTRPTRFYGENHTDEKANIEKAWTQIYALPDSVSVPISDEAMLRYGVSATPTFVFVDRDGVVTRYLPSRMTEERLSAAIEDLLR